MSKDIKNVVNKNIEIINKSVHKDLNNTNINYNSKFDTSNEIMLIIHADFNIIKDQN